MPERDERSVVLVPLKSFAMAKSRLSSCLSASQRVDLSRWMATRVVAAAAPLDCVVVCDDPEVADFACSRGAATHWTPGLDLNGALLSAVERMAEGGAARVVIAAGDLPFAHDLGRLDVLRDGPPKPGEVLIVGDRHDDGTNVLSFATAHPITTSYGPGSLARHVDLARRAGLPVSVVHDEALAWDIDTPHDLLTPAHLGSLAGIGSPVDQVKPTRKTTTLGDAR